MIENFDNWLNEAKLKGVDSPEPTHIMLSDLVVNSGANRPLYVAKKGDILHMSKEMIDTGNRQDPRRVMARLLTFDGRVLDHEQYVDILKRRDWGKVRELTSDDDSNPLVKLCQTYALSRKYNL